MSEKGSEGEIRLVKVAGNISLDVKCLKKKLVEAGG